MWVQCSKLLAEELKRHPNGSPEALFWGVHSAYKNDDEWRISLENACPGVMDQ